MLTSPMKQEDEGQPDEDHQPRGGRRRHRRALRRVPSFHAAGERHMEYGVLLAYWGYGAAHEGARYEVHLC